MGLGGESELSELLLMATNSLRQLDDERAGKVGVLECVRTNVLRQYEVIADKDNAPVSRTFSTIGTVQLRFP